MITDPVRARRHGCAVLSSEEQGWEVLAEFIAEGVEAQEQTVVVGLRAGQATELLRRLHEEQGIDPDPVVADGQLVVMDEAVSAGFLGLPGQDLTALVTTQVDQAMLEGYRGVRLTGVPGAGIGPHELTLDRLVRVLPLTVLCAYFRNDVTAAELDRVRGLHAREVVDTAVFGDGRLRITRPRPWWLRLAGSWDTGNHQPAVAVLAEAVAAGDRDLDVASLRSITPSRDACPAHRYRPGPVTPTQRHGATPRAVPGRSTATRNQVGPCGRRSTACCGCNRASFWSALFAGRRVPADRVAGMVRPWSTRPGTRCGMGWVSGCGRPVTRFSRGIRRRSLVPVRA